MKTAKLCISNIRSAIQKKAETWITVTTWDGRYKICLEKDKKQREKKKGERNALAFDMFYVKMKMKTATLCILKPEHEFNKQVWVDVRQH